MGCLSTSKLSSDFPQVPVHKRDNCSNAFAAASGSSQCIESLKDSLIERSSMKLDRFCIAKSNSSSFLSRSSKLFSKSYESSESLAPSGTLSSLVTPHGNVISPKIWAKI